MASILRTIERNMIRKNPLYWAKRLVRNGRDPKRIKGYLKD